MDSRPEGQVRLERRQNKTPTGRRPDSSREGTVPPTGLHLVKQHRTWSETRRVQPQQRLIGTGDPSKRPAKQQQSTRRPEAEGPAEGFSGPLVQNATEGGRHFLVMQPVRSLQKTRKPATWKLQFKF